MPKFRIIFAVCLFGLSMLPGTVSGFDMTTMSEREKVQHLAKQRFQLSLALLKDIITQYIEDNRQNVMDFTHDEIGFLVEARQIVAREILIFRSGLQDPDFFLIDGKRRIAKTGNRPGHPIFIDQDLIASQNFEGKFEAIDYRQVIAILIHEVFHHIISVYDTKRWPHERLDWIGGIVANHVRDQITELVLDAVNFKGLSDFRPRLVVANFGDFAGYSEVYWISNGRLDKLTDHIARKIRCKFKRTRSATDFLIRGMLPEIEQSAFLQMIADISVHCPIQTGLSWEVDSPMSVEFRFRQNPETTTVMVDHESIAVWRASN